MVSSKEVVLKDLTKLPKWGDPGIALAPRTLRKELATERLPGWLLRDTGLPEDATVSALGPDVWGVGGLDVMNRKIELYVSRLVDTHRERLQSIAALDRPWPLDLEPGDVPWEPRTQGCLRRSGLIDDRLALSQVTYGELLAVPQMGPRSVIDFAVTAESAIDLTDATYDVSSDLVGLAQRALSAPWAELVSGEDPRFGKLLTADGRTLADRLDEVKATPEAIATAEGWSTLAHVLPAIFDKVAEIEQLPLDVALRQYLAVLGDLQGPRLDAVLARFGFDGQPARTLQEVASILGVSRERVRQLQVRVTENLPSHAVYMPALDRALRVVAETAPAPADETAVLLKHEGITEAAFHPASVLAAARFCGRADTFEIEKTPKGERVVTSPTLSSASQITLFASRQSDAFGASNIAELVSTLNEQGIEVSEDQARDVLVQFSDAEFLQDDWFWLPRTPRRNRLYNVTRRILAVASPLDAGTIREGARRPYRFREVPVLPPRAVMLAFYRAHPAFVVGNDDRVQPAGPLDYRRELGKTEQIFVDVLRQSPSGVLDRSSFQDACEARGMNRNTFSVYSTYSPVLDHLATDVWSLRGVHVSPAAVDALRQANAARPKERVIEDYGWNEDGALWVAARLPRRPGSLVIGMPSAIAHYLADQRFPAKAEDGSPAGTIAVGESGTSWGYGPFLARRGADEGDVLVIEFQLAAGEATLKLGDADLLDAL